MKKQVYLDESRLDSQIRNIEKQVPALNKVLAEVKRLNLPLPTTSDELRVLCNGPAAYFERVISAGIESQSVKVLGVSIPFSKKKIFDSLALPDMQHLAALCRDLSEVSFSNYILKDGKVQVDPAALKVQKENCTLYATSPAQAEIVEAYEVLAAALAAYNQAAARNGGPLIERHTDLAQAFILTPQGEVAPRPERVALILDAVQRSQHKEVAA